MQMSFGKNLRMILQNLYNVESKYIFSMTRYVDIFFKRILCTNESNSYQMLGFLDKVYFSRIIYFFSFEIAYLFPWNMSYFKSYFLTINLLQNYILLLYHFYFIQRNCNILQKNLFSISFFLISNNHAFKLIDVCLCN